MNTELTTLTTIPGEELQEVELIYEIFGVPLHGAPIIVINHSLTGNSHITGTHGWWSEVVGEGKTIDLKRYTVVCINIPGNGYRNHRHIKNYKSTSLKQVAVQFWSQLNKLGIFKIHALIGGSIGGCLAWEMAFLRPRSIEYLIPIAANLRTSDWLRAQCFVQEQILLNSSQPIALARMHAMTLYRHPISFERKFNRRKNKNGYEVEQWLEYHGKALEKRFSHPAYLLLNHLLTTVGEDLTDSEILNFAKDSTAKIHSIAIDSDYLFTRYEQYQTYRLIKSVKEEIYYREIHSPHGHDAFLMEFQKLNALLKDILK